MDKCIGNVCNVVKVVLAENVNACGLLYADYAILLADNPNGLQQKSDCMMQRSRIPRTYLSKTKLVVFHRNFFCKQYMNVPQSQ